MSYSINYNVNYTLNWYDFYGIKDGITFPIKFIVLVFEVGMFIGIPCPIIIICKLKYCRHKFPLNYKPSRFGNTNFCPIISPSKQSHFKAISPGFTVAPLEKDPIFYSLPAIPGDPGVEMARTRTKSKSRTFPLRIPSPPLPPPVSALFSSPLSAPGSPRMVMRNFREKEIGGHLVTATARGTRVARASRVRN